MSTSLSGAYELTQKGPDPIGCWKNLEPSAVTSFCGTTEYAYMARSASSGACFCDSVITTVCASGAVTALTGVSRKPQPPANLRDRSIEYTTSLASTGWPLQNLASVREWKV